MPPARWAWKRPFSRPRAPLRRGVQAVRSLPASRTCAAILLPPCDNGLLMVLMIDNYDSFTYNLVQYLGELGEEVVVRRNDEVTLDEIAAMAPDKIVISPGPCTP